MCRSSGSRYSQVRLYPDNELAPLCCPCDGSDGTSHIASDGNDFAVFTGQVHWIAFGCAAALGRDQGKRVGADLLPFGNVTPPPGVKAGWLPLRH